MALIQFLIRDNGYVRVEKSGDILKPKTFDFNRINATQRLMLVHFTRLQIIGHDYAEKMNALFMEAYKNSEHKLHEYKHHIISAASKDINADPNSLVNKAAIVKIFNNGRIAFSIPKQGCCTATQLFHILQTVFCINRFEEEEDARAEINTFFTLKDQVFIETLKRFISHAGILEEKLCDPPQEFLELIGIEAEKKENDIAA